jgi:hypothetical protein
MAMVEESYTPLPTGGVHARGRSGNRHVHLGAGLRQHRAVAADEEQVAHRHADRDRGHECPPARTRRPRAMLRCAPRTRSRGPRVWVPPRRWRELGPRPERRRLPPSVPSRPRGARERRPRRPSRARRARPRPRRPGGRRSRVRSVPLVSRPIVHNDSVPGATSCELLTHGGTRVERDGLGEQPPGEQRRDRHVVRDGHRHRRSTGPAPRNLDSEPFRVQTDGGCADRVVDGVGRWLDGGLARPSAC